MLNGKEVPVVDDEADAVVIADYLLLMDIPRADRQMSPGPYASVLG